MLYDQERQENKNLMKQVKVLREENHLLRQEKKKLTLSLFSLMEKVEELSKRVASLGNDSNRN